PCRPVAPVAAGAGRRHVAQRPDGADRQSQPRRAPWAVGGHALGLCGPARPRRAGAARLAAAPPGWPAFAGAGRRCRHAARARGTCRTGAASIRLGRTDWRRAPGPACGLAPCGRHTGRATARAEPGSGRVRARHRVAIVAGGPAANRSPRRRPAARMAAAFRGRRPEHRLCRAVVRFCHHCRRCLAGAGRAGVAPAPCRAPHLGLTQARKDVTPSSVPPGGPSRPAPRRSLKPLFAVLLMSLAPVIAAVIVYFYPALRPAETTNYGTLYTPQRPMPSAADLPLATLDGQAFDLNSLKGKWVLAAAHGGACPPACARKLFIIRNTHASQGK